MSLLSLLSQRWKYQCKDILDLALTLSDHRYPFSVMKAQLVLLCPENTEHVTPCSQGSASEPQVSFKTRVLWRVG